MASGSSAQGGDGTDVSLADLVDLLSGSPARGQRVQTPFVSPPVIGKLRKVAGSVTITRENVIIAQPAVGDLVYEGDLIETGIDGLIAIVFVDGTTFRLYDSAQMVLDEFVFSAEGSSNTALFRVLKGRFSFLSGLVATAGRLMIDTAVARIQNTRPAAGIGGLAFSAFTIGLIHELNAASADIALLDDGTITCKDLKHGVFEIVTKGEHPQRFIVDDPCVSINFQIVGSQVRVSEVANTPGQMALFHEAFLSTLDSFLQGQQDSLIQKWQHADAGPQSTTTVGSSTQLNGLNNVTLLLNENGGTLSAGSGTTSTTTTTTANLALPPLAPPPPPSNIIIWTSSSPGTWETAPNWNADAVPTVQDIVEINVLPTVTSLPLMVTVDEPESVGSLVVGAGVVLDIIGPNGSLIVSNASITNAGMIEVTSGGTLTIDPSMLTNSGLLEANGATLNLTDDIVTNTGTVEAAAAGIINLKDTTIDGGTVLTAAAGDVIEATSGISTISDATISNAGTLEANGATLNLTDDIVTNTGTVEATGTGIINLQETTIDGGTVSTIGTSDLIEATSGTSTISDATISNAGTLEANGAELDLVDSTVANTGTVEATGTEGIIDLRGATINGGTVSTAAAGDVIEATSGISTISGATVSNAGTIEATDLATLTIDSSTINNSGLLEATGGGTLVIDGNVTGGGSAAITGGGMLELGGTDAQAVAVSGAGTLKLDGSSDFTGTVAGLAVGDVIDLANTIVATAVWNGSTLTVNGTPTTFAISGLPSGDTFFFTSDGASGTDLTVEAAPTITINAIDGNNILNASEAAAGFTIRGTAADSGVGVDGQTVIVDIVNGSDKVVDSYTGTVQSDGSWSVNVSSTDAQALSNGSYTVTANLSGVAVNPATETTQTLTVDETPPVITAPTAETIGVGKAALIPGGSLTESGTTAGETFTVIVADTDGLLTVTPGSAGVSNNDSKSVTITGSLGAVSTALGTLSDTDSTPGTDTITVNATDGFGNVATQTTTTITVNTAPILTTPAQTIDVDLTDPITGVVVTETGNTSGEVFTVTLSDSNGDLSANMSAPGGGGTINGSGTTSLTIMGTLVQVNADLATLTDTDGTRGSDPITLTAKDSFGNTATQQIAVTVIDTTTVSETVSALSAAINLVTNGGFETDTLTGWTLGGNYYSAQFPLPQGEIYITSSYSGTPDAQSGQYAVALGSVGSDGTLSQTLQTTVGQHYTLSFWLANETSGPDDFTVTWDGKTLLALTNAPAQGYTEYTYVVTGTGSDVLEFAAQQDPSQWNLDSISVLPDAAVSLNGGISLNGAVSVSDAPDTADILTTTLTVIHGTINVVATPGGATVANNDSSSVTLTGTAAEIDTSLGATSYIVNPNNPNYGSDSLTATTTDTVDGNMDTKTVAITITSVTGGPAGVAGSPINLALANPSAADGDPVAVTVTGLPSGWQLNEGTNLGNGTWTVETTDLSALTVITAAAYAGAMVLSVTESWTNADGSTGIATIADNVEAYAPGAPIFALSGHDTLTGAGGNDEYVFAQPIGNDTIYNFNAATDKIDLIGFANVASFSNIQANIAEDGNGDAVITIGAGETITLQGVNPASLTAADFVFNQTPVLENDGTMVVSDGAMLPLGGTIDNSGTIALSSSGDQTELQIIGDGVTLQGGGQLTLSDSDANIIVGTSPGSTLTNVDNTISGAGQIGIGDGNLTLVNEAHGTIDANVAGGTLTLDTGNTIVNAGLLEATNGGALDVQDGTIDNIGTGAEGIALGGTSTLLVDTATLDLTGGGGVSLANGSQIIENADSPLLTGNGGSLHALDLDNVDNIISGAGTIGHSGDGLLALTNSGTIDANVSGETLTVNTGNAIANTGTLEASNGGTLLIDDAVNNSGAGNALIEGGIVDFASTTNVNEITFNNGSGAPAYGEVVLGDPTNGQNVTVNGFTGTAPNLTDSDSIDLTGTWTVESETSSGANTVLALKDGSATVTLTFDDFNGTLNVASDGNGGTLITDPPATNQASPSVSIGGPGNDNFVFHPGIGADTGHFDPPAAATEYGQFTSPVEQHWLLQIKQDAIEGVHIGDANTPPDLDATHWHALHDAYHLR